MSPSTGVSSPSPAGSGGSASPGPTPEPSPGFAWTQVVSGLDALMTDATAFPGGVVAVGGLLPADRGPSPPPSSGTTGQGECQSRRAIAKCAGPVAWVYGPDGSMRAAGPMGTEGGGLQRVAWTGTSLVAIGCSGQAGTGAEDCPEPIVWASTDGTTWTPAAVPPIPPAWRGLVLRDLIAVGGEAVVAGCLTMPSTDDVVGSVCTAAAVWRSADDGRTWRGAELLGEQAVPGLHKPVDQASQVLGLGTDGSLLLAGGFAVDAEGTWGERIWSSADGAAWEQADVEAAGEGEVGRIVRVGEQWLALGTASDQSALWSSADGRTWRLLPDIPGKVLVGDILPVGGGLVAIGVVDGAPAVWTSLNGDSWYGAGTGFVLHDPELALVGDRIVALGREGVWLSDPVAPAVDIR